MSWSYKLDYETDEMIKEICVWCSSRNLEFWNWFGWLNWVITYKYKAVYRAHTTFIIGQDVVDHFLYKFAFCISMITKFSFSGQNMSSNLFEQHIVFLDFLICYPFCSDIWNTQLPQDVVSPKVLSSLCVFLLVILVDRDQWHIRQPGRAQLYLQWWYTR